ncbi:MULTISPECIES: hypothetical protein [Pseudomonas]|uniref:hypothetical protein n=1 Tax=Pseudomonas TaxID=286 RepID=UPI000B4CA437|nr:MULTISPECIES: hypothetical protein [Pseudomonas]AOA06012.1 hypothetical protein BFC21_09545 [Pseudomonas sp. TMW 2.1634]ASC86028.1 hypothetical protein CDA60_06295 [Pseudomonas fragi]PAA28333.1 hypothetical protein CJU73_11095 [Pseudomonas fragi]
MPTKSLRILIADADPNQALKIERALNILGYYRIAPLYHGEALVSLKAAPSNEYDVLLVSQGMVGAGTTDEAEYRKDNAQFRHVLIYTDADSFVNQLASLMPLLDASACP